MYPSHSNSNDVLSRVHLPSLHSNVLLVYRVTAIHAEGQSCSGELNCCNSCCSTAHRIIEPLLPSLLEHDSFSEAHFHPLTQSRPLLLHTHTGAPFTSSPYERGLNLTLYTSPDCPVAFFCVCTSIGGVRSAVLVLDTGQLCPDGLLVSLCG